MARVPYVKRDDLNAAEKTMYDRIRNDRNAPEVGLQFRALLNNPEAASYLTSMGAVLRCVECPEVGGDTMWANQYLAYDTLSDGMKKMLERLKAAGKVGLYETAKAAVIMVLVLLVKPAGLFGRTA